MAWKRERVLITVKTYPTLSTSYGETVCTAGLREDGAWIRLYPVPFRRLEHKQQYNKYDWIECRVAKQRKDPRPESFRPVDESELVSVGRLDTKDGWRARREIVERGGIYDRLEPLFAGAKANELSLATFKPAELLEFRCEPTEETWSEAKVAAMRAWQSQHELFEDNEWRQTFHLVNKLPFNFSYRIRDADGRASTMQILDWELGALYWNCLRYAEGDREAALAKVRAQYFDNFRTKDLHLFLGTTQRWHGVGPNPWLIIGVFYPPMVAQLDLF